MIYIIALISIVLGSVGQFLLKLGSADVKLDRGLVTAALSFILNLNIVISLFCFFSSMIIWVLVLKRLELSIAYPMVSLGYIITMTLAFLFLNEPLRLTKLLGTALIIFGVIVINIR
ncbi:MAG TPA: EamA family transporter [Clostridia bacterium]|nr:EamA family transporter [Clostridia bacterium]